MEFTDEELIKQFAALSADEENNPDIVHIPEIVGSRKQWDRCLIMKVMTQQVVHVNTFATALRRSWNVHPDTVVDGLGANCFLIELKEQMDVLRLMAKGIWRLNRGDMVISRQAQGPQDLVDPQITEADCWIELHGIPADVVDSEAVQAIMNKIGTPLTEVNSMFYGGKRIYKQKLKVNIVDPLKPKLPMMHPVKGICWVYVVYENMSNICMFCAKIGHEHGLCPAKFRLKQLQQQQQYKDQLGAGPIPEMRVGKWINDRTLVPREFRKEMGGGENAIDRSDGSGPSQTRTEISTKRHKRPMEVQEEGMQILVITADNEEGAVQGMEAKNQHLNFKRAREANPNSPPGCQ